MTRGIELIYLDTCILVYLVEGVAPFDAAVRDALASAATTTTFAISPLVKAECLVKPLRTGDLQLQARFEEAFQRLRTLELPETVFLQAAQLRARAGLKMPDALHLACAQHHRCTALWTNDQRLDEPSHGFAMALPRPN